MPPAAESPRSWPLQELDVRGSGLGRVALGEGEHLVGHVEAEGATGRPHPLSGEQDVDPAARAEVEHPLAFVQLGDRDRVAAAQRGEDGRVGELGALEGGVQLSARRLGGRIPAATAASGAIAAAGRRVVGEHSQRLGGVVVADLLVNLGHRVLPWGYATWTRPERLAPMPVHRRAKSGLNA